MILVDPVNDFHIPQEWIDKVSIPLEELMEGVNCGLLVVLSNGNILHRGFTTGTTAAAAAKAAVLSLVRDIDSVSVPTPSGIRARLEVNASGGRAEAVKISGDHENDATGGAVIVAEAIITKNIHLSAGTGVGTVTKTGLQVKSGKPAINPVPKCQIMDAINEALEETGLEGAGITISVLGGEAIAAKTLNPALGVEGGISILGTTGFVEPWGDHLGETKMELIKTAARVVLTTGRIGMRYSHMLFPDHTVIMVGSRLDEGVRASNGETVICGLPGIILRWAMPDILEYTGHNSVQEMIDVNRKNLIIDDALRMAVNRSNNARIVLVDRAGAVIRDSGKLS